MYCIHCGQQNDPAARFCMVCGKPMPVTGSAPPVALPRACNACGVVNRPGVAFCEECGATLLHPDPTNARAMKPNRQVKARQTAGVPVWLQLGLRFLVSSFVGFVVGKLAMWLLVVFFG